MDRTLQFLIFFSIIATVFGLIQWYVLKSYSRWLVKVASNQAARRYRLAGYLLFALANILFLLRFPSTGLGFYQNPLFQSLIIYPGGIFFGSVVLAFIVLLMWNTGKRSIAFFRKIFYNEGEVQVRQFPSAVLHRTADTGLIDRRKFLKTAGTAMIAAPAFLTIGSSAATSHDYQVIRKRLYYPGLPDGLDGLRIVQISDIHSGIYMTETQMRDIFHLANEQQPDLVAITGDFVDNSPAEIPALSRAVTDLKADIGIYGCLGNHDHYASADEVSSAMSRQGIHILTNAHQTITVHGEKLTLLGVDDIQSRTSNLARINAAANRMPDDGFRILLSHRPDLFDDARKRNIHLTLSGHTHGGQIGFNVLGVPFYPIHLFHDYAKGLYDFGDSKLYVNVGIGMVGVPVRLVRPELTVIDLAKNPSA